MAGLCLSQRSEAFRDEVIPGPEEHARNPGGFQSIEERLVVRDDDRSASLSQVEERVIRGPVALDCLVIPCEPDGRPRVAVVIGHRDELREDGRGNPDVDIPQDAAQLRFEMDSKLERHQHGVRVKKDEPRHPFRPSGPRYMALR